MSETSRKIIEGVTELGAENGMYGMTSKAISKKCECSEGVIFKHFNTLEELKKEVYYNIDSEIYKSISSVEFDIADVKGSILRIWNEYFGFLLANPVKTKYYKNFRGFAFKCHWLSAIITEFNEISKKFGLYEKINYDVLWYFIIDNSLSFAMRISDGSIENTEKNKMTIFNIIFKQIIDELGVAKVGTNG